MNGNGIDPDLVNLAGFVRNDMTGLDKMNMGGFNQQNKINMPPRALVHPQGLSPFLENPSANYAGSEVVGMEVPNPSFIPIPDDMRERVLAMAREESEPNQQIMAPPHGRPQNVPNVPNIPNVQPVKMPDVFDVDLFQFAVLKDLSGNLQKVLLQLQECKKNIEAHKQTIDTALSKSPMSKK
jgi:hypothetical protein